MIALPQLLEALEEEEEKHPEEHPDNQKHNHTHHRGRHDQPAARRYANFVTFHGSFDSGRSLLTVTLLTHDTAELQVAAFGKKEEVRAAVSG